jgi:hypothetical protein
MLKAEGVRSGVADIMLPVPVRPYYGLFIEMKVDDNKQSATQMQFNAFVLRQGYMYVVAYTWVEAWQYIVAYLRGYQ